MARYLDAMQFKTNLRLGKAVEQWLSHYDEANYTIIKWLRIDKESDESYSLAYFESLDEGGKDCIDIYHFSLLDPDELGGVITTFTSTDDALEFAITTYKAFADKFVTGGMIQEEYRDYINSKTMR